MNKETLIDNLIENGIIENICSEYGEQGYNLEQGKKAILFADWNQFDKHPNFMEWVEQNYELEWSDEWIIDYDYDKAYRTQADSYGWEQQWRFTEDGEMITPDSDIEDWLDVCAVSKDNLTNKISALPSFIEEEAILKQGYKLISDDNESGLYNRNDDPKSISRDLLEQGYSQVLFSLNFVSQFNLGFSVYVK